MAEDVLAAAYLTVIAAMTDRTPRPLERRAALEAEDIDPAADVTLNALAARLQSAALNDPLASRFHADADLGVRHVS